MLYKSKATLETYCVPPPSGSKLKAIMFKSGASLSGVPTITNLGSMLYANQENVSDIDSHVQSIVSQQRSKAPSLSGTITTPTLQNILRSPKGLRHIPHRPTRLPAVRTPPSDLWTISEVKTSGSITTKAVIRGSTSTSNSSEGAKPSSSPPPPFLPPGLGLTATPAKPLPHEPTRPTAQPPIGTGRPRPPALSPLSQSPVSSAENLKLISPVPEVSSRLPMSKSLSMSMISPSPLPPLGVFEFKRPLSTSGIILPVLSPIAVPQLPCAIDASAVTAAAAATFASLPPFVPKPFAHVLSENKRRNPHAPSMVSQFNPLRDQVPFRAWACMPVRQGGRKHTDAGLNGNSCIGPALPSTRYNTSLLAIPTRSRTYCDSVLRALQHAKEQYFKKTFMHCRHCKRDTMWKKHLTLLYYRPDEPIYLFPPGLQADTGEEDDDDDLDNVLDGIEFRGSDSLNDKDVLESPILRDIDDFDSLEGMYDDDDGGDDIVLGDMDMRNHALF